MTDLSKHLAEEENVSTLENMMALNNLDHSANVNHSKVFGVVSPKFNESSIPPFSKEAFNEMAANYQIELTPEPDYQMMINNQVNRHEESLYSQN